MTDGSTLVFVSNGGSLKVNTTLNEGGANSRSDILVVDSTQTGSGGATRVLVNNVGGEGALTQRNGIAVVELLNMSPSASAPAAFVLARRAVAGPYEYRLFRGAENGSDTDAWYLRSDREPDPPVPPTPPAPPTPPSPPQPLYRPEVAAYLANQRLAGQMFVHSLHDRLGEPQYVEGQGFDEETDKPGSGWLRVVGKWEGTTSKDGVFSANTNAYLINGGAEFARWKFFGESDRVHVGAMASYGNAYSNATAAGNPAWARGTVEGWALGAYGTWYQNDASKLGAYVDTWFQYGWFNNSVQGEQLDTVNYHANGWAISGETGYAIPLRAGWVVEPQAQIIYVDYRENSFFEPNGTQISGANSTGLITRLGVRTDRTWVFDDHRKIQPYLTLNWWYAHTDSSINFNVMPLGSLYPRNWFEAKLGVNADLGKRWTTWANVAGGWGQQSFHEYAVRGGLKYTW